MRAGNSEWDIDGEWDIDARIQQAFQQQALELQQQLLQLYEMQQQQENAIRQHTVRRQILENVAKVVISLTIPSDKIDAQELEKIVSAYLDRGEREQTTPANIIYEIIFDLNSKPALDPLFTSHQSRLRTSDGQFNSLKRQVPPKWQNSLETIFTHLTSAISESEDQVKREDEQPVAAKMGKPLPMEMLSKLLCASRTTHPADAIAVEPQSSSSAAVKHPPSTFFSKAVTPATAFILTAGIVVTLMFTFTIATMPQVILIAALVGFLMAKLTYEISNNSPPHFFKPSAASLSPSTSTEGSSYVSAPPAELSQGDSREEARARLE